MDLWNSVFYKQDITLLVGLFYDTIKRRIDNKEKSYSFNNYDDREYRQNKTKEWTVFINEYNFYDKVIHSYKLYFTDQKCTKVEKRF